MAARYWVSPAGLAWDNTNGWSTSSGGASGASVPGPSDIAVFDGNGPGYCVLNVDATVLGLRLRSDYSSTLFHSTNAFSIGTSDASFDGGRFMGGTENITVFGDMYIGRSEFISTSADLSIYGDFVFDPYSFLTQDLIVQEDVYLSAVDISNKYIVLSRFPLEPENVLLNIIRGTAQKYTTDFFVSGLTLSWSGTALEADLAEGDHLRVIYLPDTTQPQFDHNNGRVRLKTENKRFSGGGMQLYDLQIENEMSPVGYRSIDSSSYVENRLSLASGYLNEGTDGTIHALSDIFCNAEFGRIGNGHDAAIEVDGSVAQTLAFSSGGVLPSFVVDKTTSDQLRAIGTGPVAINDELIIFDGTFNTNGLDVNVGNV